jgi:hypothetical protein
VTQPNAGVDEAFRGLMPWFVKPFVGPFFAHHKA